MTSKQKLNVPDRPRAGKDIFISVIPKNGNIGFSRKFMDDLDLSNVEGILIDHVKMTLRRTVAYEALRPKRHRNGVYTATAVKAARYLSSALGVTDPTARYSIKLKADEKGVYHFQKESLRITPPKGITL
jgi:hypothetical protein